jgi:hypothetical protein
MSQQRLGKLMRLYRSEGIFGRGELSGEIGRTSGGFWLEFVQDDVMPSSSDTFFVFA